ncbi:hypothetical protein, partial [Bradyrhizobium sp. Mp27]
IRPLTLTRKNSLFAGHDEGGRSWARIASLIATCKINSFSRAVRRDADDNGRQAEAHDDHATAIRARVACATPA